MRQDAIPGGPPSLTPGAGPLAPERLLRMQGLVLESMREGVSVSDEQGHIIYTNPAEDRMFGYAPGELIGLHVTVQNTYPPEENARIVEEVIARLRTDGVWEGEFDNVRKDGSPFVTHARITALELDGRPYWVCVQEDVTERRAIEARTRVAQEVTSLLSAALTPEQVAQVVIEHALVAVGAQAGSILRLSDDERALQIMRAAGYAEGYDRRWARVAIDRRLAVSEAVQTRAPVFVSSPAEWDARFEAIGPVRALEGSCAWAAIPLLADDRVLGVLALSFTTRDALREENRQVMVGLAQQCARALERARLYQAAQDASRAKTQFLATMSHELRTPLNAIDGYAELMELGIHGPVTEAQRDALGRLRRSQRHLLGLINEVLNYTRVEAGAVRYELSDVPVAETLAAVEGMLAPQLRAKGLSYTVERCDDALTVRADAEKLQQILVNLLTNAVKFTPAGGAVRLSCDVHGDSVELRVADTGVGIPAEKLEAIFEPFVQVDARLTRTQDGVGLGLAISRDLARGMGGDITAASTPGQGAVFTLVLPRP